MTGTVLTFQPGDPVPPWFMAVEPRSDVAPDLPRLAAPLTFQAPGRVVDDGSRYVVSVEGDPKRIIVGGEMYYCHIVVERPILWPDGAYWPGCGVPTPAAWAPDPVRVKAIAAVEGSREALLADRTSEATYHKAALLVGAGVLIGLLIMGGVVATVLAVLT